MQKFFIFFLDGCGFSSKVRIVKAKIDIKGRVEVGAELFARFKKLNAEKLALEKAVKALQAEMNLPEAAEGNVGTWIIANGNGDEMGKVSISARAEFTMPACIVRRVS